MIPVIETSQHGQSSEWRNPLSRLQNRAGPFQICPLICQIRAFRLFWPDMVSTMTGQRLP
jgi:hypothetical protein